MSNRLVFKTVQSKNKDGSSGLEIANAFDLRKDAIAKINKLIEEQKETLATDVEQMKKYQAQIRDAANPTEVFNDTLGKASKSAQDQAEALRNGTMSAEVYEKQQKEIIASTQKLSLSSRAAAVGMKALSVAMNVGVMLLVSAAIQGIVSALNEMVLTTEEATKRSKELAGEIRQSNTQLQSNRKTVADISDDYKRLSEGVDEFGNNIGLTESEFEQYNSITQKIANMFPSMIQGYTEQGDVILKNKGNVQLLNEELDRMENKLGKTALTNLPEILEGYNAQLNNTTKIKADRTSIWWLLTPAAGESIAQNFQKLLMGEEGFNKFISQRDLNLGNPFELNKVNVYSGVKDIEKLITESTDALIRIKDLSSDAQSAMVNLGISWGDQFDSNGDYVLDTSVFNSKSNEMKSIISDFESEYNSMMVDIQPAYEYIFKQDKDFSSLSGELQAEIQSMFRDINPENMIRLWSDPGAFEDFVKSFADTFTSNEGKIRDNLSKALDLRKALSENRLSPEDFLEQMRPLEDAINATLSDFTGQEFRLNFNSDALAAAKHKADLLLPSLTPLKDIFKDLTSSASLLSQAWNEMNDNGELSVSTVLALMEADAQWTAVLEVVNGKLIINKDLFVESCKAKVRAKIEEAKQVIAASQKEIQAIIAENKALMSGAAGLSGKTWVEDQIRPLQQSTKEAETNLKALEAVLNSLSGDKPFDGITDSAKNASSAINELKTALSSAKSAIDNLLSMTISMIKQDYADQREALQDQLDGIRDKYEAEKEGIEEVQKAQKKANDDAKKALQDQLDGYRKIIQAQIDLLREKENQHDYERGLNEKQSDVGKIQNQLDARQNDDSAEAKAKRLELMDELQKKQDELAEYQHDHSIEIQEDALNKELKAYEDKMQSQMDALDEEADRMEEIHRQRLDQIEAQYQAEAERIQREIEENERAANNEAAVRTQAIALIEGRSGEFYNRLLEWNRQYGIIAAPLVR